MLWRKKIFIKPYRLIQGTAAEKKINFSIHPTKKKHEKSKSWWYNQADAFFYIKRRNTNFYKKNNYSPFEDDREVPVDSKFLLAASGMCVKSALKKLYNCWENKP